MKCEKCGIMLNVGQDNCPNCGTEVIIKKDEASSVEQTKVVSIEQPVENNINPEVVNAPKNVDNKKKTIIAIIVAAALIIGAIIGYTYIYKAKTRFLTANNNAYKKIMKMLDNQFNSEFLELAKKNTVSINYDINFTTKMKNDSTSIINQFNDLNLKLNVVSDSKNNKNYMDISLNKKAEEMINANIYMTSNKTYYKIKDVLDNYLWLDADNKPILDNVDAENYKYLSNIVKSTVFSQLKDSNFKQEKATINLDNEDKKFTKISLNITDKLINDIMIKTFTKLKNDKKSIEILCDMSSMKKNEMIKQIEDGIKSLKAQKTTNEKILVYALYIKGYNNVVKYAIEIPSEYYGNSEISFLNYKNENKKMEKRFEISTSGMPVLNISFLEQKNDIYNIKGDVLSMATIEGKLLSKENKNNLELNVLSAYDNSQYSINYNIDLKEVNKNKKYVANGNLSLVAKTYDEENFSFSMDMTMIENVRVKFPKVDTSNSKNVENITEEESNKINEKLMNLPIMSMFTNTLMSNVTNANKDSMVSTAKMMVKAAQLAVAQGSTAAGTAITNPSSGEAIIIKMQDLGLDNTEQYNNSVYDSYVLIYNNAGTLDYYVQLVGSKQTIKLVNLMGLTSDNYSLIFSDTIEGDIVIAINSSNVAQSIPAGAGTFGYALPTNKSITPKIYE